MLACLQTAERHRHHRPPWCNHAGYRGAKYTIDDEFQIKIPNTSYQHGGKLQNNTIVLQVTTLFLNEAPRVGYNLDNSLTGLHLLTLTL